MPVRPSTRYSTGGYDFSMNRTSGSLREVRAARFATAELKLGPAGPGIFTGVEAPIDASSFRDSGTADFAFDTVVAGSREFSLLPFYFSLLLCSDCSLFWSWNQLPLCS